MQNLQAERTQLLYELGEVEYEKRLLIERLEELKSDYDNKIDSLKSIEFKIDTMSDATDKNFLEKLEN